MKPLVSIALPVLNSARTIAQTLASIQAQGFTDYEVLVGDDGSRDGTLEIVQQFADARYRVFSDGRTLGIAARLNQLVREARGRYIARMDADDLMHPDRLARQVTAFESSPELDVLGTDAFYITVAGKPLGYYQSPVPGRSAWRIATSGGFIHPTVMGRTEWFLSNPYSTEAPRAEDMELWMRTCSHSQFNVLPEALLYYRRRAPRELGPDRASQRTVDRLILQCGRETGREREARRQILRRQLQFGLLSLNALCGIRSLRWHIRSKALGEIPTPQRSREFSTQVPE